MLVTKKTRLSACKVSFSNFFFLIDSHSQPVFTCPKSTDVVLVFFVATYEKISLIVLEFSLLNLKKEILGGYTDSHNFSNHNNDLVIICLEKLETQFSENEIFI